MPFETVADWLAVIGVPILVIAVLALIYEVGELRDDVEYVDAQREYQESELETMLLEREEIIEAWDKELLAHAAELMIIEERHETQLKRLEKAVFGEE